MQLKISPDGTIPFKMFGSRNNFEHKAWLSPKQNQPLISQTSHTTYPDEGVQLLFYLIPAAFDWAPVSPPCWLRMVTGPLVLIGF